MCPATYTGCILSKWCTGGSHQPEHAAIAGYLSSTELQASHTATSLAHVLQRAN